jgi:hypothetical protein
MSISRKTGLCTQFKLVICHPLAQKKPLGPAAQIFERQANNMSNKIKQNRLVIEIACECLKNDGFTNVNPNKKQGTFPDVHVTADRDGVQYLIGITGREEIGAQGEPNPSFNIVQTADDRRQARVLAKKYEKGSGVCGYSA